MANFKFVPNLFLESIELQHFRDFLDVDGFRKNILENSINFGLIKSNADKTFANGLVQRDIPTNTIKVNPLYAIDSNGQFIYSPGLNAIPVTNDNNWYWLKVSYQFSNLEAGTISIAVNGDITGTGTQFTKIFRGQPNFPTKLILVNSDNNVLQYEVLDVIDDTHATLANPATNVGGLAEFVAEEGLTFAIVGTFTGGANIPTGDQFPFQYDAMQYSVVLETQLNTRPSYSQGLEFYLARFQVNGANVIIQDKRTDFWETKGSQLVIDIDRDQNPLIGVEAVKWQNITDPSDKNIVEVAWGMRCSNWSINSSQNILILNAANGGIYKTVNDFNNGDFNGWRVYIGSTGKYSYVIDSVKQGGAINLTLDTLNVDDYSSDGGSTFVTQEVIVVPNCEEVELMCYAKQTSTQVNGTTLPVLDKKNCYHKYTFPVNIGIGRLDLECYYNPACFYQIQYRYKSHKEYGEYFVIPTDLSHGYYTEVSFDADGLLNPDMATNYTYSGGYIKLNISPNAYSIFQGAIDKGDLIGVNSLTSLNTSVINLIVGTAKNYQYISGNISITGDVYFNLNTPAVEGNEFRIHFNCTAINLSSYNIYIVQNYQGSGFTILKKIAIADVYSMLNQDGGICFDCKYTGSNWAMYENYDIGQPFEVKMIKADPTSIFDNSGNGNVKGWFGWQWMNGANGTLNMQGRTPIGNGVYTEGGTNTTYSVGDQGGEKNHVLTKGELPAEAPTFTEPNEGAGHSHPMTAPNMLKGGADSTLITVLDIFDDTVPSPPTQDIAAGTIIGNTPTGIIMDNLGSGDGHNNLPPYSVLIFAQRLY